MPAASTRLKLRVSPMVRRPGAVGSAGGASSRRARRAAVVGRHGDAWKVRVAEAPERGRANEAVLRLLADALAVPRDSLTLVSGHAAREKIVELTGFGPALIERRLASAAALDRGRKDRR